MTPQERECIDAEGLLEILAARSASSQLMACSSRLVMGYASLFPW
jgi:hypothetical protein